MTVAVNAPPNTRQERASVRAARCAAGDSLHIGFVQHSLCGGGAERVAITLAEQLTAHGHRVDLVLGKSSVDYANSLSKGLRVFHPVVPGIGRSVRRVLCARGVEVRPLIPNAVRARADFQRLRPEVNGVRVHLRHVLFAHLVAEYLRRERPSLLLSALAPANFAAVNGAWLVPGAPPVVISVHSNLCLDYSGYEQRVAATLYPRAAALVAVSRDLGNNLLHTLAIPQSRVHAIYNPVPDDRIRRQGQEEVAHPWFRRGQPKVILGVAREARAKDHPTLVEALGHVRREVDARLVIMGRHSKSYRRRLLELAREHGVEGELGFLDFAENPYCYMARASVVALSSFWEGLPTVLLEALACGTPVVSTDTPFGPREILQDGKWGRLAPVGDAPALGRALAATLRGDCPDADALRRRAADFSTERAVAAYLRVFEQVARQ